MDRHLSRGETGMAAAILVLLAAGVLGLIAAVEARREPLAPTLAVATSAPDETEAELVLDPEIAAPPSLAALPDGALPPAPDDDDAPRPPTIRTVAPPQAPRSLDQLRARARAGDAVAQHELGERYAAGTGVPRNDERAAAWFREAAIGGLPEAQYRLAELYRAGRGVAADPAEALIWLSSAADRGHAPAEFALARLYAAGELVAADPATASRWLRRAAEHNHAVAQFALGAAYETGDGVERSAVEAYAWYALAASSGNAKAAAARDSLAARLDEGEREAAEARAAALASLPSEAPPALVREIQRRLAASGYDAGPADGVLGERTAVAIRRYQAAHGLAVDGAPSEALLLRLRHAAAPPAPVVIDEAPPAPLPRRAVAR